MIKIQFEHDIIEFEEEEDLEAVFLNNWLIIRPKDRKVKYPIYAYPAYEVKSVAIGDRNA